MLAIIKFGLPVVGVAGALAAMSHAGLFSSNENKTEPVDTSRDYFLVAKHNKQGITKNTYSDQNLYTNIETKEKNFECKITSTSITELATEESKKINCSIYKRELPHLQEFDPSVINALTENELVTNKSDFFDDNLFQIVVDKEKYEVLKKDKNIKIHITEKSGTNKLFGVFEGFGWYQKDKIHAENDGTKTTIENQIKKYTNTSYLLAQFDRTITSAESSGMTSDVNNSPKTVNYKCQITKANASSSATNSKNVDCRVYLVPSANWKMNTSTLQPPVETNLIDGTSGKSLETKKYYQIALDSKHLFEFEDNRDLKIKLVKKGDENSKHFGGLKSIYEFKRSKKIGEIEFVLVQVTEKNQTLTENTASNITYKTRLSKDTQDRTIILQNLHPNANCFNQDVSRSSTKDIKTWSQILPYHTCNMNHVNTRQTIFSHFEKDTFLIMANNGNDSKMPLYDLVGKELTINATNTSNSATFKVKVMTTIAVNN